MKNKIYILSSALSALLFFYNPAAAQTTAQKNNFILTVTAKGLENKYVYFSYRTDSSGRVWDSAFVTAANRFAFEGFIPFQTKAYLTTKKNNVTNTETGLSLPLYLQPGKMTISITADKFADAILKGSVINDEYIAQERKKLKVYKLLADTDKIEDSLNVLTETLTDSASKAGLAMSLQKAQDIRNKIGQKLNETDKAFIRSHPNSIVSADYLLALSGFLDKKESEVLYNGLSAKVRQTIGVRTEE